MSVTPRAEVALHCPLPVSLKGCPPPDGLSSPPVTMSPNEPALPAQSTPSQALSPVPEGVRGQPPTPGPSPAPRWPRCGSGSRPGQPRPPPPTAPPVPSPGLPWPPAVGRGWVRVKWPPWPGTCPSTPKATSSWTLLPAQCFSFPSDTHPQVQHVQRHSLFGE